MTDKSILIVEDEPPLAELLRYNIETGGFKTLMTTCGEEALLTAAEENIVLTTTDAAKKIIINTNTIRCPQL